MDGQTTELLRVLSGLGESAAFCVSGVAGAVLPGLEVEGVGDVGVPVSAADAKRVIHQARQAPYGRGRETIVDTNVRKVWQLEPQQFALRNAEWRSCVTLIVDAVRQEFGIAQKVEAQLYKLLVYEKGSFFAPHRDTEKSERMFATLVICLPSKHDGGTLILSHDGETKRIEFGGDGSRFQTQYTAFYADCQHEVTPVTSGYRVCLVYNLAIAKSKRQPSAPVSGVAKKSVAALLTKLFADKSQEKVAIPLKHQYTEAGLGDLAATETENDDEDEEFDDEDDDRWDDESDSDWDDDGDDDSEESVASASRGRLKKVPKRGKTTQSTQARTANTGEPPVLRLKGSDRARLAVLARAAEQADCQAFVALLTHWQSGSVDYGSIDYGGYGWGRSRRWEPDESSAEFEDVCDESMTLSHWFDTAGHKQPFAELNLAEEEIISDTATKDRPYRQQVHEATGNEGVSMERWYHQAVVVIWPRAKYFSIMASAGPASAVPALEQLIERTDKPSDSADCRRFAKAIIAKWRAGQSSDANPWDRPFRLTRPRPGERTLPARMLSALLAIDNVGVSSAFVSEVLPSCCDGSEGADLTALAHQHGWKKLAEPFGDLFARQKPGTYGHGLTIPVSLFEALCCLSQEPTLSVAKKTAKKSSKQSSKPSNERLTVCRSLAEELWEAIERWDGHQENSWRSEPDHRVSIVEPVVRGLAIIEAKIVLMRFIERATTDPKHYDLHTVLIPAVTALSNDQHVAGDNANACGRSAFEQLHQYCVAELETRTAKKPQPPADWSRKSTLDCNCADCRELSEFLKSKTDSVRRFPRRKDLRQHLHQQIDKHRCDVTHVTERKGSPQTLICTKTQASFEHRLKQFEIDRQLLSELFEIA